jgi:hypothetical protein
MQRKKDRQTDRKKERIFIFLQNPMLVSKNILVNGLA